MRLPLFIVDKLADLCKEYPNYSFGEILFSVLRKQSMRTKPTPGNEDILWIREIEDNEFLTACEKALDTEKEE